MHIDAYGIVKHKAQGTFFQRVMFIPEDACLFFNQRL